VNAKSVVPNGVDRDHVLHDFDGIADHVGGALLPFGTGRRPRIPQILPRSARENCVGLFQPTLSRLRI
jgi:hypothetical protein